jgi:hypothetical protein
MATLREYEKLLEKMEQAVKPFDMSEAVVLFMADFSAEPLIAIQCDGLRVERREGESEGELRGRAAAEARAKTDPRKLIGGKILTLYDVRQRDAAEEWRKHLGVGSVEPEEKAAMAHGVSSHRREVTSKSPVVERTPDVELEELKAAKPDEVRRAGGASSKPRIEIIEVKNTPGVVAGHWMMG